MLGFFIIGVLAIAVGAFFIAKKSGQGRKVKVIVGAAALAVGLVICVSSCVRTVPTGHTGIVTTSVTLKAIHMRRACILRRRGRRLSTWTTETRRQV